jgi:hypothetical protein
LLVVLQILPAGAEQHVEQRPVLALRLLVLALVLLVGLTRTAEKEALPHHGRELARDDQHSQRQQQDAAHRLLLFHEQRQEIDGEECRKDGEKDDEAHEISRLSASFSRSKGRN